MKTSICSLILSILLLGGHRASCQQEIVFGEGTIKSGIYPKFQLIGKDGEDIILLASKSPMFQLRTLSSPQLVKLDPSMNPILAKKIRMEYSGNTLEMEFVLKVGEGLYAFASFHNQSKEQKYLFCQELDLGTFKPAGEIKLAAEVNCRGAYYNREFKYRFSNDRSKVLVYANASDKKNELEAYSFSVFNEQMEKIWGREVQLPYTGKLFKVKDYVVDNWGQVYLLGQLYFDKLKEDRKGLPNFEYHAFSYGIDGANTSDFPIELGDLFLRDMLLETSPEGDLVCAGFYSNGRFDIYAGTYYLVLDRESKTAKSESHKEFDLSFGQMHFEKEKARKTAFVPKMGYYELKKVVPMKDGGSTLVAEQVFTREVRSTMNDGKTKVSYYYYAMDIMVVSISPEGEIRWANKIPKAQVTGNNQIGVDPTYLFYFGSMVTEDTLYFVYNDNRMNLGKSKITERKNYTTRKKNGIVTIAAIDAEGNLSRRELLSYAETDGRAVPNVSWQVSPNEFLLVMKKGSSNHFAKLLFE